MGRDRVPDQELLADLRRVAAIAGVCTLGTYQRHGQHADGTIRRHFGTWEAARRQAGLPPLVASSEQPTASSSELSAARYSLLAKNRWDSQREALREATRLFAERHRVQQQRPCLRCERPFGSTGPANRLCKQCLVMIERDGLAGGIAG